MTRVQVLNTVAGRSLEGWDIDYFLEKALRRRRYSNLKDVLKDLDAWIGEQE